MRKFMMFSVEQGQHTFMCQWDSHAYIWFTEQKCSFLASSYQVLLSSNIEEVIKMLINCASLRFVCCLHLIVRWQHFYFYINKQTIFCKIWPTRATFWAMTQKLLTIYWHLFAALEWRISARTLLVSVYSLGWWRNHWWFEATWNRAWQVHFTGIN